MLLGIRTHHNAFAQLVLEIPIESGVRMLEFGNRLRYNLPSNRPDRGGYETLPPSYLDATSTDILPTP